MKDNSNNPGYSHPTAPIHNSSSSSELSEKQVLNIVQAGTSLFPGSFTMSLRRGNTFIGDEHGTPLHAISVSRADNPRYVVILHDGPDAANAPEMACVADLNPAEAYGGRRVHLTRPVSWRQPFDPTGRHKYVCRINTFLPRVQLAVKVGLWEETEDGDQTTDDRPTELFQWRRSEGAEVRRLRPASCEGVPGWKLVCIDRKDWTAGGTRDHRPMGRSSWGEEIVAVAAPTDRTGTVYRFDYLQSGLDGVLGKDWEESSVLSLFSLLTEHPVWKTFPD